MSDSGYKVYIDGNYMDIIYVPMSAKSGYIGQLAIQACSRLEGLPLSSMSAAVNNESREVKVTTS